MSPAIRQPEITSYIESLFALEDPLLRELRARIGQHGFPEIYISPEVGRLLQLLLAAIGARRVLEIGTLGGYSALWMANALPPEGRLLTLEREEERAELAREFIARAGFEDRIEVRVGDARELLPAIAATGEPFDACFIDAGKADYPVYLEEVRRMVRPGGLILADNALRDGKVLDPSLDDGGTAGVRRFNAAVAVDAGLLATILPVRDGLTVALVRD